MGMRIQRADLRFFDVHLYPTQLFHQEDAKVLRAGHEFLASSDAYNAFYSQGQPREGASFTLRPLQAELSHSHFWRTYGDLSLVPPTRKNPWDMMLPLLCLPRGLLIRLEYQGLVADCLPSVWLWPFGWSSRLDLTITGDLSPNAFAELCFAIQRRPPSGQSPRPVFLITEQGLDGATRELPANSLSKVFQHLTRRLSGQLHERPYTHPPTVHCHGVLSISSSSVGHEPWSYEESTCRDPHTCQRFHGDERTAFHSAILGRKLEQREVTRLEGLGDKRPFSTVSLKSPNFAVIYAESGALLYLANRSANGDATPSDLQCMANNWRDFTAQFQTLRLLREKFPTGEDADERLSQHGKQASRLLPALSLDFENHPLLRCWRDYYKEYFKQPGARPHGA